MTVDLVLPIVQGTEAVCKCLAGYYTGIRGHFCKTYPTLQYRILLLKLYPSNVGENNGEFTVDKVTDVFRCRLF